MEPQSTNMIDLVEESLDRREAQQDAKRKEWQDAEVGERDKLGKQFGELTEQVEGLTKAIKQHKNRPNFNGIEVGNGKDQFSWQRALQLVSADLVDGLNRNAMEKSAEYGYEMEVFAAGREQASAITTATKASINAATDSGGGFLIPMEVQAGILPLLETSTVLSPLGVPFINDVVGNIAIVKEKTALTAYYVDSEAEDTLTESASTYENITLVPHELGALVPVTKRLMRESSPAVGQHVMQRITQKLAQKEDYTYFLGTGSASEPLGLDGEAGILTETFGGADTIGPTSADLVTPEMLNMIKRVENANAPMTTPGWATGVTEKYQLRSIQDADGRIKYNTLVGNANSKERLGTQPQGLDVLGYPLYSASALNASAPGTNGNLWFGDWSQRPVWRWGTLALEAATMHSTDFAKGRISIRGWMAHDFLSLQDVFCKTATWDATVVNS